MKKHTPGPWLCGNGSRFIFAEPVGPNKWPNLIGSASDNCNAEPYNHPEEVILANACLMAAAPELLRVCKDILERMESDSDLWHITAKERDELKLVIRAAEGE